MLIRRATTERAGGRPYQRYSPINSSADPQFRCSTHLRSFVGKNSFFKKNLRVEVRPGGMYWISKSIHRVVRLHRRTLIFLAAMGPGIITMVADNDAGGISTYAQTGAKTGFNLLWAFIILVPMAYYVQEMTVRSFVDQKGWTLLNEHLMGRTILDMDGRKTEVVNDIQLLYSRGRMIIIHVDTSFNGFLRRWGLERFTWADLMAIRATALTGGCR